MSRHLPTTILRLVILASALLACKAEPTTTPQPAALTLHLSWSHGAQFAGLYVADQRGYYAAEGLRVTFLEGGPGIDRLAPVLAGTAHLGIASPGQLITGRAAGQPVRAVATIFRRDPFVFFALADSGITRPEDFVGKTILVPVAARPLFRAMMARGGLAPDQYTEITDLPYTALFTGELDVANGFVTSQVLQAQRDGYALNLIFPDDYGVHFYSDTIFATDDFIAANPALITRFLRATFKGWTWAVEHPDDVGPLVRAYRPDADPLFENAVMTASLPFVNTGEDHIGWMKAATWAQMVQTLHTQGVLTATLDPTHSTPCNSWKPSTGVAIK